MATKDREIAKRLSKMEKKIVLMQRKIAGVRATAILQQVKYQLDKAIGELIN